ncbi:MAG: hypothetical protein Q8R13_04255, partial [bacterium]|nr:hypothetical protein [bacterium]
LVRVFFAPRLPGDAELYRFAKALIPKGKGKEWNWAMMDAGALVCKATQHDPRCPFRELHGKVRGFRYKKPQARFKDSRRYWRGRILFYLAKRSRGYSGQALRRTLGLTEEEFDALIETLKRERLVESSGKMVYLPGKV